jgi:hypothetical protein
MGRVELCDEWNIDKLDEQSKPKISILIQDEKSNFNLVTLFGAHLSKTNHTT